MPFIYIIHCKQHINSCENVYKIGQTIDFNKRLSGYVKGSMPILSLFVNDEKKFETNIKKILPQILKQRLDCGEEYFEGDIKQILIYIKRGTIFLQK